MAEFPSLNLWTDAWLADTAHLPRIDRDIYFHLLILMWRTPKCRVPRDIEWIARRLQCSADEVTILENVIREFCSSDGNWLVQKRLRKEYSLAAKRRQSASANAKSRWDKDKGTCGGNASITIPITIDTEESPLPPGGGREISRKGSSGEGRRKRERHTLVGSFHQAAELLRDREAQASGNTGGGHGSSGDDPVGLPRLRHG